LEKEKLFFIKVALMNILQLSLKRFQLFSMRLLLGPATISKLVLWGCVKPNHDF